MKWNGENSVVIRHEQEERRLDIMESDEGGVGAECPACGEKALETDYICKATNTPSTGYCVAKGRQGCMLKRIGDCAGYKTIQVCDHCGEIV